MFNTKIQFCRLWQVGMSVGSCVGFSGRQYLCDRSIDQMIAHQALKEHMTRGRFVCFWKINAIDTRRSLAWHNVGIDKNKGGKEDTMTKRLDKNVEECDWLDGEGMDVGMELINVITRSGYGDATKDTISLGRWNGEQIL